MLTLFNGHILFFYEAADLLYINHKEHWIKGLMKRGIVVAFINDGLITIAVILYISPLLVVTYQFHVLTIVFLAGALFCAREIIAYLNQFLSFSFSGLWLSILQWVLKIILFIAILTYYHFFGVSIVIFGLEALALGVIIFCRDALKDKLMYDIDREERDTQRLQKFIVGQAGVKKPIIQKKRPLFYRNSKSIFRSFNPVNVTADVFIKAKIRDGQWLLFYWQMTIYSAVAIRVFQGPYNLLIPLYVGTTCLFGYWLKNELVALNDHLFFRLIRLNSETKLAAIKKIYSIMALPGILVQSIILGYTFGHWVGLLVSLPLGLIYTFLITRIMFLFVTESISN